MDGNCFQVSAPGKVILHGEHSVVHGKRAVACAIDSRITITTSVFNEKPAVVTFMMPSLYNDSINVVIDEFFSIFQEENLQDAFAVTQKFCDDKFNGKSNPFISLALSCCLFGYYNIFFTSETKPTISMAIQSELAIGAGLGSSAAFNTCLATTYLVISGAISPPTRRDDFECVRSEDDLSKINSLAYELERIVHSTPSGIDNSIATYGGAVSFESGSVTRLKQMPELKLLTVDTGVSRSTKTLVAGVREYLTRFPEVVVPILDSMHNIAIESETLLEVLYKIKDDPQALKDLGRLIVTNQCLLSSLGVSHPSLDRICSISAKHGFPAKLTGAGGGGCAIVLLGAADNDDSVKGLREELAAENFSCKAALLGAPGVMFTLH